MYSNLYLICVIAALLNPNYLSSLLCLVLEKQQSKLDFFNLFKMPHNIGEGYPLDHSPDGPGFVGTGGGSPSNGDGSPSNGNGNSNNTNSHTNGNTNGDTTSRPALSIPEGKNIRRPNVLGAWNDRFQRAIWDSSEEDLANFTIRNPHVNPLHTSQTL